jgi:preprotein translocase subunit SecG
MTWWLVFIFFVGLLFLVIGKERERAAPAADKQAIKRWWEDYWAQRSK